MALQQQIESFIGGLDASFGVSIKHLGTKEEFHIQPDRLFQMASCFKIPILATLYERVHKGEIDLQQRIPLQEQDYVPGSGIFQAMDYGIEPTIKDLATMMIIVSDNLATDKVLSLIGAQHVQQKMRDIGLDNIYIQQSCWDLLSLSVGIPSQPYSKAGFTEIINRLKAGEYDWNSIVFQEDPNNNVSTSRDMNRLLEQIALGEFVSAACSAAINEVLLKQHYQQRIPGLLPKEAVVANKTGSLGSTFNDAGIVYLPNNKGMFVISVFSVGDSLDYEGDVPIARIAQMAYAYFMGEAVLAN